MASAQANLDRLAGAFDKTASATREYSKHSAAAEAMTNKATLASEELRRATIKAQDAYMKQADVVRDGSKAMFQASLDVQKLLDKYDPLGTKLRSLQADFAALNNAARNGQIGEKHDAAVDKTYAALNKEMSKTKELMGQAGVAGYEGFAKIEDGAKKSAFATAQAKNELMILGREALTGNFAAMPGTFMVLARHTNFSMASLLGWGGAALTVVASAGAMLYVIRAIEEETRAMNAALAMTGSYSGQTSEKMLALAGSIAATSHQTIGETKGMVLELAASGHIGAAAFDAIANAAVLYSQASGKALDKVTPKLIKAFEDPTKGAADLNNMLHFLAPAELEHIKHLQEMGDAAGAQSLLAEELNKKLSSIQPNLGTLETAWNGVGKAASGAWDAMLSVGRESTLEEAKAKLGGMNQRLQEYASGGRGRLFAPTQGDIDKMKAFVSTLEDKKNTENDAAMAAAASAKENEKSAKTWDMITKASTAYHKQQIQTQIDDIKGFPADNAKQAKFQADAIANLQKQLAGPQIKATKDSYDGLFKSISQITAEMTAEVNGQEKLTSGHKIYIDTLVGISNGTIKLTEVEKQRVVGALQTVLTLDKQLEAHKKLKAAQDAGNKLTRSKDDEIAQIQLETSMIGKSAIERKSAIEAQKFDLDIRKQSLQIWPEYRDEFIKTADVVRDKYITAIEDADRASRSFASGMSSALGTYQDEVTNTAAQTGRVLTNSFHNAETAMVKFFTTGKFQSRDFFNSLAEDIARVGVQRQITGPAANFLFGSGVGGGVMGGVSSWFSSAMGGEQVSDVGARAAYDVGANSVSPYSLSFTPTHHAGYGPGDALSAGRYVHPAYFDDAPRFHTGIGPGERAAIITQEESVLTPGQMRMLAPAGGGMQSLRVEIVNNGSAPQQVVSAQPSFDGKGMVVSIVLDDLKRGGPISSGIKNLTRPGY
ncbi:MAG: phage tail length tape measure family protein [Betaproteobacteria bacterium]|nr:phage tail length tape measure family protein [Betaproteobacteria bacterium]